MGNKNSCCSYSSPAPKRKDDYQEEPHMPREGEGSVGNIQHISEREPEDWDADPSLHPTASTIFLERSRIQESNCAQLILV